MSSNRAAWTEKIARDALKRVSTRTKFNNRKTTIDGFEFDSAKEARRWQELVLEQKAGNITELRRQVPFPLYAHSIDGPVEIAKYLADFTYVRGCRDVVEDVKSPPTRKKADYRIKAKAFAANHGFDITEIL